MHLGHDQGGHRVRCGRHRKCADHRSQAEHVAHFTGRIVLHRLCMRVVAAMFRHAGLIGLSIRMATGSDADPCAGGLARTQAVHAPQCGRGGSRQKQQRQGRHQPVVPADDPQATHCASNLSKPQPFSSSHIAPSWVPGAGREGCNTKLHWTERSQWSTRSCGPGGSLAPTFTL